MATGMVSSQNSLNPTLQATAVQPTVLRSGESISTNVKDLKDPNAKTFYHMVPGARFVMPDGLECRFLGGQFTTTDPAIIAELSKIVNRASSMIYVDDAAKQAMKAGSAAAAADAVTS